MPSIRPISFGEHSRDEPYNASEIVAVADGQFLFCDNNLGDALLELRLSSDGSLAGPIQRRPLRGIAAGAVDDLEGMTVVSENSRQWIFAVPSLSLKRRKGTHEKKGERGKPSAARGCLLRIARAEEGLDAEMLAGFREWVIEQAPILGKAALYLPDDGGLNVEGLGWCPASRALLLGLRTPVVRRQPLVLRVRIKQLDGPWELSNLEMLPPVCLAISTGLDGQGIRSIGSDTFAGVRLVVTGNSTSRSKASFALYAWDGNPQGTVRRFEHVRFHKRMKVEGVTHGTVGGRDAIVFVDDAGGYQLLWRDDPRLDMAAEIKPGGD